jgi:antagonist of KipI
VLGSRATHLVSHMGGFKGRALAAGDRVPIATSRGRGRIGKSAGLTLPTKAARCLRVMPGRRRTGSRPMRSRRSRRELPHLAAVESHGLSPAGPAAARARGRADFRAARHRRDSVPSAGEPILLMADRQTAGGYPKIGYVISADLPLAGQLAPGDFIEFHLCSQQEAVAALIARERSCCDYADCEGRVVSDLTRALEQAFGADRVKRDAPLAPFTTFKVGGPADFLIETQNATRSSAP